MKYYLYIIEGVVGSLFRVDLDANPIILERWAQGKWVFDPETLAVTGLASDADNYKEITKQEAEKYIKKRSRPQ